MKAGPRRPAFLFCDLCHASSARLISCTFCGPRRDANSTLASAKTLHCSCKTHNRLGELAADAPWCTPSAFKETVLTLIAHTLPLVFGETTRRAKTAQRRFLDFRVSAIIGECHTTGGRHQRSRESPFLAAPHHARVQRLRYSSSYGLCGLIEDLHRFADFRNAQNKQRRIRCGVDSAIAVVNIDAGVGESRRSFRQRADTIRQFYLSHLRLGEIQLPMLQNLFCCGSIISHQMNQAPSLRLGVRLKTDNVDIVIGQRSADISKSARLILRLNREFRSKRHMANLL